MEFPTKFLAFWHSCQCLGYKSLTGKKLIEMLEAHVCQRIF